MVERAKLSPSELQVLKALWAIDKGSVGEIHANLDKDMDYSTVQTYVRRLEAKGYIKATRIGRNKVYRAAVEQSQVAGEAVDELLENVFDGELLPMVKHLVDARGVTPEEVKDLMRLVRQLQREQKDGT